MLFQRKNVFSDRLFSVRCPKLTTFSKSARVTLSRRHVFPRASQHNKRQGIRERRMRERKNLGILPKNYTKITQIGPKTGLQALSFSYSPPQTSDFWRFSPPPLPSAPDLRGWGKFRLLPSQKPPVWGRKENLDVHSKNVNMDYRILHAEGTSYNVSNDEGAPEALYSQAFYRHLVRPHNPP